MSINIGVILKKDIVLMDSPSGVIECKVTCENDEENNISIQNVPSFALYEDKMDDVPNIK